MKRGPKPMPSALRRLIGNPGNRPVSGNEPQPEAAIPQPPDHLDELAVAEWERLAPELHKLGLLSRIDRAALACYCMAWSRWVRAEQHLREHGEIVQAPSGAPIQNPWLSIANRAFDQLKALAAEFGMSPSSRSRVNVTFSPQEDELDLFKRDGIGISYRGGVSFRDRYGEPAPAHEDTA